MPKLIDEPTPTEELPLPRLPAEPSPDVSQGEPGMRAALRKLEELEEAIRLHEQATGKPAAQRRPKDIELSRRLDDGNRDAGA